MVDRAVRVVISLRRRAEPHFIIKFRRISEAWRNVAKIIALDRNKLADAAIANEFARSLIMRRRPLLSSDLDHPLVAARHIDHPAAFLDEKRERLLDVYIFACVAGHHAHQSMPMIGRGDHYCVDALVIEQSAEIAVELRARADELPGRFEPRL